MRLLTACVIALLAFSATTRASAQETPPSPPRSACPLPEPDRAIRLALDEPGLVMAIAEALGPRNLEQGTPVHVVDVLEGDLATGETIADKRPTFNCFSEGLWLEGRPAFGVFLPVDEGIWTLAAWPLLDGEVQLGDERLTVDELLERGRAFVPSTPGPVISSAGTGSPPVDVSPPVTGLGAEKQSIPVSGIAIAAGAMLVGLLALVFGRSRASGRRR